MRSTVIAVPQPPLGRGTLAAAGFGAALLFAFTGWITQRLLAGDSALESVLTAVMGFAFFGWVSVVLLALLGTLAAMLIASVATQRRWRRARTAVAGAALWQFATALPAALGTPLVPASGFGLPEVLPAATVAGLFLGYLVGQPRVKFTNAE